MLGFALLCVQNGGDAAETLRHGEQWTDYPSWSRLDCNLQVRFVRVVRHEAGNRIDLGARTTLLVEGLEKKTYTEGRCGERWLEEKVFREEE